MIDFVNQPRLKMKNSVLISLVLSIYLHAPAFANQRSAPAIQSIKISNIIKNIAFDERGEVKDSSLGPPIFSIDCVIPECGARIYVFANKESDRILTIIPSDHVKYSSAEFVGFVYPKKAVLLYEGQCYERPSGRRAIVLDDRGTRKGFRFTSNGRLIPVSMKQIDCSEPD